ncbi:MAG: hypothetical protein IJP37_00790, partial [Clostridia bacterium]|nr:hypothetical protein [Clostridia bacterium]
DPRRFQNGGDFSIVPESALPLRGIFYIKYGHSVFRVAENLSCPYLMRGVILHRHVAVKSRMKTFL